MSICCIVLFKFNYYSEDSFEISAFVPQGSGSGSVFVQSLTGGPFRAKALAEKNERDLQTQREQADRHWIVETLDAEIKRWASGKEGNLRALLSTMQYVCFCDLYSIYLTSINA
ncbi:hypothetical protein SO802_028780 [Lithocarpus litseifolius]|uniref:Uncharacterized protein n=1 Tax=Lithocarpus litseifolius TaxID=425828 RepID=A0AAW2BT76_9ROSI